MRHGRVHALLDFAILDLHCVYLWVESSNEHAIGLYRKVGFSERGTMRELACRNGKHCNVKMMDLLKSEFQEKHGILPKKGAATAG